MVMSVLMLLMMMLKKSMMGIAPLRKSDLDGNDDEIHNETGRVGWEL